MRKIICARCGKEETKTGRYQKYCAICQPIVKREQKTAAEARRRARYHDKITARNRERYAADPEKFRAQSREYRAKNKDNPIYQAKIKQSHAKAIDKWLDKRDFGGNWYKVFDRDGGRCQTCGSTYQLVVHHKDLTGWGASPDKKNNDMSNLILLCSSCHMKLHRKLIKSRRKT
jgi:5-methylcytosine-specific restriction endonuclease McrA